MLQAIHKHWRSSWFAVAAILLLAIPLLFWYLNGWAFIDPDEGRYGSIPRQMIMRGDFITPTQNSIKFFDKPPLLYWAIAASYSLFGFHEWAARLVPALAALAGIFAVYGLGRRMFGPRAGLLGALVLSTSLMWPLMGRVVMTDMLVSSLVFCALALWWLAHSETSNKKQTAYFLAFWATLALGVLAKGPIAVVLVGGSLFLYFAVCKQWRALQTMRWSLGVPLFFLIAAPWYVLVAQRNPEFNHFFWFDQHIARFLGRTTGNDHVQGVSYYLKFLPIMIFPWSFFVPAALAAAWQQRAKFAGKNRLQEKPRAVLFLLCAFAFVMLFFSASSGKIVTYILPVVPLGALLLAIYFDWVLQSAAWNRVLVGSLVVLCLVLTLCGVALIALRSRVVAAADIPLFAPITLGLVVVVWGAASLLLARRFGLRGAIGGIASGFVAFFSAALPMISQAMPAYTTASLVRYIRPGLASPDAEVICLNYIQSLEFYTRRRVEILTAPDEMSFGIAQMPAEERAEWVFEGEDEVANIIEEMADPHPVYCFIRQSRINRARIEVLRRKLGNGAGLIIFNRRFVVFGNRAAVRATPPTADARQYD